MARFTPELEPPYSEELNDILAFSTFAAAEATLRRLEILCRKYEAASDKKGVEYCRRIAVLGRRRAELISRNPRVDQRRRLQKKEIANWFGIWLETPAIFTVWLEMRKKTEEFKRLLAFEASAQSKPGEHHAHRGKKS